MLVSARWVAIVLMLALFALAGALSASDRGGGGVDITVTTAVDSFVVDGLCSLREAVIAASFGFSFDTCPGQPGGEHHTITLVPPGPYVLTLGASGDNTGAEGDLDVLNNLTIRTSDGQPRIIDGNHNDRILHIRSPVLVELRDLVLQNGRLEVGSGAGIAVEVDGVELDLEDVEIRNNVAESGSGGGILMTFGGELFMSGTVLAGNRSGGSGGGLAVFDQADVYGLGVSIDGNRAAAGGGGIAHFSSGVLNLWDSAVTRNMPLPLRLGGGGMDGGGVYLGAGDLMFENVTLSSNVAERFGGGLTAAPSTTILLKSVTVTNNAAETGGGIDSVFTSSTFTLLNSIVAGNAASFQGPDCLGNPDSDGHNLLGDVSGCTLADCGQPDCGDLVGLDPLLTPLGDHGGPTRTHLLISGSPAIDAADPSPAGTGGTSCPIIDQRLLLRPFDGDGDSGARCDIGAVEMHQVFDPMFLDGFESGDTSAWTSTVGM